MKSEKVIRELLGLMEKRYKTGGTELDEVIMVADAFECCNTLHWVLGEAPGFDATLEQAGIMLGEEVKDE